MDPGQEDRPPSAGITRSHWVSRDIIGYRYTPSAVAKDTLDLLHQRLGEEPYYHGIVVVGRSYEGHKAQLDLLTIFNKEPLKKWKSLEGDWRTFRDGSKEDIDQEWRSSSPNSNDDRLDLEDITHENPDTCESCPDGLRDFRRTIENLSWTYDQLENFPTFCEERCYDCISPTQLGRYPQDNFDAELKTENRPGLEDVVHSSYPLLEENFSLLERLKKERDVCRKLESDMRNLEGQIQDVSKSFEIETGDPISPERLNNCERGYDLDPPQGSPRLSNSFDHMYCDEEPLEEDYEEEGEEPLENLDESDPLVVIEKTFSRLLQLADRIENNLQEDSEQMVEFHEESTILTSQGRWAWEVRCRELLLIPDELRCLVTKLQTTLRQLLTRKDWSHFHRYGERECSSPASFTFQGFSNSQVIVPTVRAIFTQVGDSIELRPIETNSNEGCSAEQCGGQELTNGVDISSRSSSIDGSSPRYPSSRNLTSDNLFFDSYEEPAQGTRDYSQLENPEQDEENLKAPEITSKNTEAESCLKNQTKNESPNLSLPMNEMRTRNNTKKVPGLAEMHERSFSEIGSSSNIHQSSEIIKRIERLQELVRPELCESLKQRALRIHRAKEEFLSGLSMPVLYVPPPPPPEPGPMEVVIDKIPSAPNSLTVKEHVEEPVEEKKDRAVFPFLRKKRKDWFRDKQATESLMLDDKSDWLRNPFRPKGKYKITNNNR